MRYAPNTWSMRLLVEFTDGASHYWGGGVLGYSQSVSLLISADDVARCGSNDMMMAISSDQLACYQTLLMTQVK